MAIRVNTLGFLIDVANNGWDGDDKENYLEETNKNDADRYFSDAVLVLHLFSPKDFILPAIVDDGGFGIMLGCASAAIAI